ncbi:unnamed protein product [Orchesella dallaii]|uniref:Protein HTATIP2 n=1 Tax=Orchesella dallaii TaxID=48710 RepID=A0ABP1RRF7_9HEXA
MLSQQIWTLVFLGVAIYFGFFFSTSSKSGDSSTIVYTGKLAHVSLEQLDNVVFNQNMDKKLKAFILGATGAVGKELVKVLAADGRFEKVTLIGRREVPLNAEDANYQKFENQLIDFEKLDEYKDVFKGHDVGFSALGTTRKKSGAEGFYKVDHDYVVQTAKLAKEGGCAHFHAVTTAGANKNSYFLYPKTKGEVEEELTDMNFPKLTIYRPAVLLVDGGREDARLAEAILQSVLKPLDRLRWFSVDVPLLAKVMVSNCFRETPSRFEIVDNAAMNKLGKQANGPSTQGNNPESAAQ